MVNGDERLPPSLDFLGLFVAEGETGGDALGPAEVEDSKGKVVYLLSMSIYLFLLLLCVGSDNEKYSVSFLGQMAI